MSQRQPEIFGDRDDLLHTIPGYRSQNQQKFKIDLGMGRFFFATADKNAAYQAP